MADFKSREHSKSLLSDAMDNLFNSTIGVLVDEDKEGAELETGIGSAVDVEVDALETLGTSPRSFEFEGGGVGAFALFFRLRGGATGSGSAVRVVSSWAAS